MHQSVTSSLFFLVVVGLLIGLATPSAILPSETTTTTSTSIPPAPSPVPINLDAPAIANNASAEKPIDRSSSTTAIPSADGINGTSEATRETAVGAVEEPPRHVVDGEEHALHTAMTSSVMQESRSFNKLERNVKAAVENLPDDLVSPMDRKRLRILLDAMFNDFRFRTIDDIEPVHDKNRRLPYGLIHRRAHDDVDALGISVTSLPKIHTVIHLAFTNSFERPPCYHQYSNHHTGCLEQLGSRGCNKVGQGISERDKNTILNLHNEYRSEVARGVAVVGNSTLPAGRAISKMIWDDELALLAQAWADQCNFINDCSECRRTDRLRFVGQNIARLKGLKYSTYKPVWRSVVASWASKKKYLPVGSPKFAPGDVTNNLGSNATTPGDQHSSSNDSWTTDSFVKNYHHDDSWAPYTQIIWDFAYLIGCGFAYYKEDNAQGFTQLYVCNYGPAGNVLNTSIYDVGTGCANCPSSHTCNSTTKLCEISDVPSKQLKEPAKNATVISSASSKSSTDVSGPKPMTNDTQLGNSTSTNGTLVKTNPDQREDSMVGNVTSTSTTIPVLSDVSNEQAKNVTRD